MNCKSVYLPLKCNNKYIFSLQYCWKQLNLICTKCISCNNFYLHWFYLIAEEEKKTIFPKKYENIYKKWNSCCIVWHDFMFVYMYIVFCFVLWLNWRGYPQLFFLYPACRLVMWKGKGQCWSAWQCLHSHLSHHQTAGIQFAASNELIKMKNFIWLEEYPNF